MPFDKDTFIKLVSNLMRCLIVEQMILEKLKKVNIEAYSEGPNEFLLLKKKV